MNAIQDAFANIRASLQRDDIQWNEIMRVIDKQLSLLEREGLHKEFLHNYEFSIEEQLARKFNDWGRSMELSMLDHGAWRFARCITISCNAMTKARIEELAKILHHRDTSHITTLNLESIQPKNLNHLVRMLAPLLPPLRGLGLCLDSEYWRDGRCTDEHFRQVYDTIFSTLALDDLEHLLFPLYSSCPLPAALCDALASHTSLLQSMREVTCAIPFEHSQALSRFLGLFPKLERLAIRTADLEIFSEPVFTHLKGLRVFWFPFLNMDPVKHLLSDISQVSLQWEPKHTMWKTWTTTDEFTVVDIEPVQKDVHRYYSNEQLYVTDLDLHFLESCYPLWKMKDALFMPDGSPRVNKMVRTLHAEKLSLEAFILLMQEGPTCFPSITSLELGITKELERDARCDWAAFPAWLSLTRLKFVASNRAGINFTRGFWETDDVTLFPRVKDLNIHVAWGDSSVYTPIVRSMARRFPRLEKFEGLSLANTYDPDVYNQYIIEVLEMLKDSGLLERKGLASFDTLSFLSVLEDSNRAASWAKLVSDASFPLWFRHAVLDELLKYATKQHLVKILGPASGLSLKNRLKLGELKRAFRRHVLDDTHAP